MSGLTFLFILFILLILSLKIYEYFKEGGIETISIKSLSTPTYSQFERWIGFIIVLVVVIWAVFFIHENYIVNNQFDIKTDDGRSYEEKSSVKGENPYLVFEGGPGGSVFTLTTDRNTPPRVKFFFQGDSSANLQMKITDRKMKGTVEFSKQSFTENKTQYVAYCDKDGSYGARLGSLVLKKDTGRYERLEVKSDYGIEIKINVPSGEKVYIYDLVILG